MRVGIVMPVVLTQQGLLDLTLETVRHLVTSCDARLYMICNGLHACSELDLEGGPR
jgi:hypothetical protein